MRCELVQYTVFLRSLADTPAKVLVSRSYVRARVAETLNDIRSGMDFGAGFTKFCCRHSDCDEFGVLVFVALDDVTVMIASAPHINPSSRIVLELDATQEHVNLLPFF